MTNNLTVLEPRSLSNFVQTPYVEELTERALGYIAAGFPLHLRGVSGTGKTTMAMHIASKLGRPVIMIHGDEALTSSDLIGTENGYNIRKIKDNFIHSVLKTEEDMKKKWMDNRLTVACKYGFTMIYDEFTRSRPEANNVLLPVLQERMLDLPISGGGNENYLMVDPNFTAIFTSNPEEYAGVHRSQDALRDRMVTLDLDYLDGDTEIAVTQSKSGLSKEDAEKIVKIVRGLRDSEVYEFAPTVRGCVMIAKTARIREIAVTRENPMFHQICTDILGSETSRIGSRKNQNRVMEIISKLIDQYC